LPRHGDRIAPSVALLWLGVGTGLATSCEPGERDTAAERGAAPALAAAPAPAAALASLPDSVAVLVGAGDIADCDSRGDEQTAALLDTIPGTVFTAGDNAYGDGTPQEFARCYAPSWGRHKARTRPSPGNHDYETEGATGYYTYFGTRAGPVGRGYYSYDLADWHVVSLNSNIDMTAGSPQESWLRADLAATKKRCIVAYFHHPRFSSSSNHGSQEQTQPLWQALYDYGADIVISGHDHVYERFALQTPAGVADLKRGIREFIVGTGGASLYDFGPPLPNSEARHNTSPGVLKLTLYPRSYSWAFLAAGSGSFSDSGSASCH
jgi:calcineurin-like phosphoesterase family protein